MELPAAKQEEILQDLIKFISQRGGAVGCERLQDFFVRHPGHRPLFKSMGGVANFCKKHPTRISVGRGDGPHLRLEVLPGRQGYLATNQVKVGKGGNGKWCCLAGLLQRVWCVQLRGFMRSTLEESEELSNLNGWQDAMEDQAVDSHLLAFSATLFVCSFDV